MSSSTIQSVERISFALRSLYRSYGYLRFKMSKFEEYDFYVRNKDFLISDSVITFTDTNGKLMALKPDVTLSIVKNSRDVPGCVQKVYYNENVYRVSGSTHAFREIVQLGLECIGDIDDYSIFEVLSLAGQSLQCISPSSVLNLSHLGVFSALLDGVDAEIRRAMLCCIRDKNAHELQRLCHSAGLDEQGQKLTQLLDCYGAPEEVLPRVEGILGSLPAIDQLKRLTAALAGSPLSPMLRIDFSVVNDITYYNGVVFKGFVDGVPQGVLSGGQYDLLMHKLGRTSGAIGFAVYTDLLERLNDSENSYDVDTVLLYDESTDLNTIGRVVAQLQAAGKQVIAQREIPEKLRYRHLARMTNGEVTIDA